MIGILTLIYSSLVDCFRGRSRLQAENIALRHQLNILRRKTPKRIRLNSWERLVFVWLYRLWPQVLDAVTITKPATIIRWHRKGFKAYWRWKSRRPVGRPGISKEIRELIREMSLANALWGAPRIHGELLKLGIDVCQTTVAKYMVQRRGPPSPSWKTFLSMHAEGIAAMDMFVVPTITFKLLYCLVIMRHGRRQLLSISVTDHPTAEWIARQITEAFPWDEAPDYMIRDRDGAYGHAVTRRLYSMGIRDRPTAPRSPWQNGTVERVIGSIRRECTDYTIVFGEGHLRRILTAYADYYNNWRTHRSLKKDAPFSRPIQPSGMIRARPILGGLHHVYLRH